jgi:hypothetical protein
VSYVPTSCILFHGPGSEETGHRTSTSYGRLLPFTGASLKKDGARELVSLLSSRTMTPTSVLVGPIDEVSPATSDVLLKVIEELDPRGVRPFLWAWDIGGVSVTLRSRCVLQFCPGVDVRTEAYLSSAKGLLKAYSQGDWVTLIESVQGEEDTVLMLRAVSEVLAPILGQPQPEARYIHLWETLRPLFDGSTLTPARVLSAFLLADQRSFTGAR